jgi:S1-C subfamily serine protease
MEMNIAQIERIERFLQGNLNAEERMLFEKELQEDEGLTEAVETHKMLLQSFGVYGNRKRIKGILDKSHQNLKSHVDHSSIRPTKTRRFVFGKRELGIAASMAFFISVGTYLVMNFVDSFGGKHKAHYKELSIDLERVKSSQDKIIRELNAGKSPIRQASSGGTAIAISENGYILTSYHVIRNADSVYIENKTFNRLKLKKVYADPLLDLVIMKVDDSTFKSFGKLPFTFRNTEMDLGEQVYTLGYPKKDIVFGEGYISSVFGYEGDTTSYQISVPVNPGQSGGPLFDGSGNLVGIVSGKHTENESSAFAVKANYLKKAILLNDSLSNSIKLPKTNQFRNQNRIQMINNVQQFVFEVKGYN